VTESEQIKGFFSYAWHDEKTDPTLVEALRNRLEIRVNGKLTNCHFEIGKTGPISESVRFGTIALATPFAPQRSLSRY
jgi:hypothetical protein